MFEIMLVELEFESLDGNVKIKLSVFILERVIGDVEVMSWKKYVVKWSYLILIQFLNFGICFIMDLLIGVDYVELYFLFKDI